MNGFSNGIISTRSNSGRSSPNFSIRTLPKCAKVLRQARVTTRAIQTVIAFTYATTHGCYKRLHRFKLLRRCSPGTQHDRKPSCHCFHVLALRHHGARDRRSREALAEVLSTTTMQMPALMRRIPGCDLGCYGRRTNVTVLSEGKWI